MAEASKKRPAKKAAKKLTQKKRPLKPRVTDTDEMNPPTPGKKIPLNQKRADLFAKEYTKDFNATLALMRLGWCRNLVTAKEESQRFLNYPRVHLSLSNLIYGQEGIIAEKTLIMNKLWEEANTAREGSTRLGALKSLSTFLGMDPNSKLGKDDDEGDEKQVPITDEQVAEFKKRFNNDYG